MSEAPKENTWVFDFCDHHRGEHWYKCSKCGKREWFAYYDKPKDGNCHGKCQSKAPEKRIEELEAKRHKPALSLLKAEAKLAKAVRCIEAWTAAGCPNCSGDCSGANPPVSSCIMQMTLTTLAELKDNTC